ncbi:hypothetical protein [Streptomyces palmae]|uniref:Uncharacterized protein n=1 Tax=Streptomyces palmae TaxID=1701085 RepID=A0A4Z0HA61_9ACTN|nr:hypothetical protein [Streptomyces palmae]TGB12915.1 hypothetical protein E4099_10890 [Streptomyces palmae]
MKKLIEVLGMFLLVTGVAGIIHHFLSWFGFMGLLRKIPLFKHHELPASIGALVLSLLLFVLADTLGNRAAGVQGRLISGGDRARQE